MGAEGSQEMLMEGNLSHHQNRGEEQWAGAKDARGILLGGTLPPKDPQRLLRNAGSSYDLPASCQLRKKSHQWAQLIQLVAE